MIADGRLTTTYSKGGAAMPMMDSAMKKKMAKHESEHESMEKMMKDGPKEEMSEKAIAQKKFFRKKGGTRNPDSIPGSKPFVG